jgi:hypothetical protein
MLRSMTSARPAACVTGTELHHARARAKPEEGAS